MKKESLVVVILEGLAYLGVIFLGIWIISIFSGTHCAMANIPSKYPVIIVAISIIFALTSEFVRWLQKEQRIRKMKKGHKAYVREY